MHVETVSDGEYDVRIHSLSENYARVVSPVTQGHYKLIFC